MLNIVSLFTGGGGLDLGLEAAGFHSLVASDIDGHSCNSLNSNKETSQKKGKPFLRHASILQADVTEISGHDLLEKCGKQQGEIDLLAGGPPCQAFSVFGKRQSRNDPRGMLIYHYLRILGEVKPKAFVFENVFGIMSAEGGAVFDEIKKQLAEPTEGLTYNISVFRLNASDFGVPQFRDRVFIIGYQGAKKRISIDPLFGETTGLFPNKLSWRTVRDGLRDLPAMGAPDWHNHQGRKHSQRIIDRYAAMTAGERDARTRINRLNLERPSFAIIVGSDAGGGKGHIHPTEPREVTPRESARMQCFPDWWWFSGTSRHPIRQIGNAVPTLLGHAVGSSIMRDIFHTNPRSLREAVELLDQEHLFNSAELSKLKDWNYHLSENYLDLPKTSAIQGGG